MTSAAFFLITHNLRNRFLLSIRRLRQPRYVAGAVLAGLYFWSFLFRKHAVRVAVGPPGTGVEFLILAVSLVALVFLIGSWALSSEGPALVFTEAEIQFFFAGPVSRRQLLAYKIIRSQVQNLFSAVIFSMFAFRGSHLLGMWVALVVLNVYTTFVSFARARLKQLGIGWAWRLAVIAALLTMIGIMANRQFRQSAPGIVDALTHEKSTAWMDTISTVAATPPLGTVLYVPRLFGALLYSHAPLVPGLILFAGALVLFFATSQMDIAFEDASIIASQRSLARRSRMRGMRSGRSSAMNRFPPPFRLGPSGRPEVAIIWKNLIGAMRMSAFPIVAVAFPLALAAAGSIFGRREGLVTAIGMMGLMITCMFVFFGPQMVRTDLRTDLLRLDVIKTFPLSAESLLASELIAPLIAISLFELAMLLVSVAILQFGTSASSFFTTPEFVVCAVVFLVPIVAIQLLIQNGSMILFPAWSMSTEPNRGFSAMGQRFLFLLGNAVTLGVALVPAAAAFVPSYLLARKLLGHAPIGILAAAVPAVGILVIEIMLAHKFLASQFEELDIANDIDVVAA